MAISKGHADSDDARTLRPLQAAVCTYRIAFGPRAGIKSVECRARWARRREKGGKRAFEFPILRATAGGRRTGNYLIVIGADGKMSSLRQLLNAANFARVLPGMDQGEVRRTLGKPATSQSYAMKPDEQVWEWRFLDGQQKKVFTVTFDREHRVLSSTTADDPREALAGGR